MRISAEIRGRPDRYRHIALPLVAHALLVVTGTKVGVSSRGELVAKLFADHYEPAHLQHAAQTHRN